MERTRIAGLYRGRPKKLRWGKKRKDNRNWPEYTKDIDEEVEYCRRKGIPFKTLRDGEVIIIE